jgi:phosphatidate phosphatase
LQIYLQARFAWQGSKLLRHFLQYLCFMMAVGTALSRISDYKHHWSDVLVGALQGALVAVLVVSRPFRHVPAVSCITCQPLEANCLAVLLIEALCVK